MNVRKGKQLDDKQKARVVKLYCSDGLTTKDIAERFGVSKATVQNVLGDAGVEMDPCRRSGVSR